MFGLILPVHVLILKEHILYIFKIKGYIRPQSLLHAIILKGCELKMKADQ